MVFGWLLCVNVVGSPTVTNVPLWWEMLVEEEAVRVWGCGAHESYLYFLLNVFVNLKLLLKKSPCKREKCTKYKVKNVSYPSVSTVISPPPNICNQSHLSVSWISSQGFFRQNKQLRMSVSTIPSSYIRAIKIWVFCTLLSSTSKHSNSLMLFFLFCFYHLHSIPLWMYHH